MRAGAGPCRFAAVPLVALALAATARLAPGQEPAPAAGRAADRGDAEERPAASPKASDPVPAHVAEAVAMVARGTERAEAQDRAAALEAFDSALRLQPGYAEALVKRALILVELGDRTRAISSLDSAIASDPGVALYYEFRGRLCLEDGDARRALADAEAAIARDPLLLGAWEIRAAAAEKLGEPATRTPDEVREAAAMLERGESRRKAGDLDGAIAEYTRSVGRVARNPQAYINRGMAYVQQKKLDRALADLDRGVELWPRFGTALYLRGSIRYSRGELDLAIADAGRAIAAEPSLANAYRLKARAEADRAGGAPRRGAPAPAAPPRPDSPARGMIELAQRIEEAGDTDGAIAAYRRAIELDPRSDLAYAGRAAAHRKRKDFARAVDDLSRAIELDPLPLYYLSRSLSDLDIGEPQKAILDANSALSREPDLAFAYLLRSRAHRALNDPARARDDLETAGRLAGGDRQIARAVAEQKARDLYARARKLAEQDNPRAALDALNEVITLIPEYEEAILYRATILRHKDIRRFDQALADVDRMIKLHPNSAALYRLRAMIDTDQGRDERALIDLIKAIELEPSDPTAYEERAAVHERLGNPAHARLDRDQADRLKKGRK